MRNLSIRWSIAIAAFLAMILAANVFMSAEAVLAAFIFIGQGVSLVIMALIAMLIGAYAHVIPFLRTWLRKQIEKNSLTAG